MALHDRTVNLAGISDTIFQTVRSHRPSACPQK